MKYNIKVRRGENEQLAIVDITDEHGNYMSKQLLTPNPTIEFDEIDIDRAEVIAEYNRATNLRFHRGNNDRELMIITFIHENKHMTIKFEIGSIGKKNILIEMTQIV